MIQKHRSAVGVFGECDSDNLGDRLIAEGVVQLLARWGIDAEELPLEPRSVEASLPVARTQRQSVVRRLHRDLYRRAPIYTHGVDLLRRQVRAKAADTTAARAVERRSFIVIGGGQLLSDRSLRMLMGVDALVRAANELGVPVLLLGVGASPPRTAISKRLFRRILEGVPAERVLVRDKESARLLAMLMPQRRQPAIAPDCALIRIRRFQEVHSRERVKGSVGLAPMGWGSLSPAVSRYPVNQDSWWCSVAQRLVQMGRMPVLFTTGVRDDFERCVLLKRMLAERGVEVDLLERPTTTDAFLGQIQSFDAVIAQRLHCSISFFGLGGTPLSLPWDRKLQSFFQEVGLPQRLIEPASRPEDACARLFEGSSNFRSPESLERELLAEGESLLRPLI